MDTHINASGMLDVGDGHQINWVDWGNPDLTTPIFYLHGGPGAGFDAHDFRKFDPKQHRVIFHDQRGSGKSTPLSSTHANTTDHLVSDIDTLRAKLGLDKISLYGTSWGSTLALVYAIRNPQNVHKMFIGSIFLGRQTDNDFYMRGGIKSHFPEVWERFLADVPADRRGDAAEFYHEQMASGSPENREKYGKEWMRYEASIVNMDYRPEAMDEYVQGFAADSLGPLEAHYLLNGCFIEEDYILKNAASINHIPTVILHGRYDFVCMPSAAYELHKAMPSSLLHIAEGGHAFSNPVLYELRKAYMRMHFA